MGLLVPAAEDDLEPLTEAMAWIVEDPADLVVDIGRRTEEALRMDMLDVLEDVFLD